MFYKHAAHRCTGLTKIQPKMPPAPPPPFLHLLLLLALSASFKALHIYKTKKNNNFASCNYCKINKFINKLTIIYTAVFVLKLITKYTHHKLKASATWLSLQS